MELWYRETVPLLYRFVYSQLHNREETEDIVQETYLRCLKQHPDPLPPYPYLKQTARNLIIDRYRSSAKATQSLSFFSSGTPSPEEEWISEAATEELLIQLPPDYRQVLDLRIIQGYSRQETARLMNRSESSVRGLQYRALQALRDLISINSKGGYPK